MTDTHEDDIERVKAAARREFEIHRTGNMDNLWLRVARAAIDAMQQWRDIESAPRDRILMLYAPNEYVKIACGYAEGDEWMMLSDDGIFASAEPTGWQPLPAPPTKP